MQKILRTTPGEIKTSIMQFHAHVWERFFTIAESKVHQRARGTSEGLGRVQFIPIELKEPRIDIHEKARHDGLKRPNITCMILRR